MLRDEPVSTCCFASPEDNLEESDGEMVMGICSRCKDVTSFYLQCHACLSLGGCDCQKSVHEDDLYLAYKEGDWPRTHEPMY